jgi:hypothetical protein
MYLERDISIEEAMDIIVHNYRVERDRCELHEIFIDTLDTESEKLKDSLTVRIWLVGLGQAQYIIPQMNQLRIITNMIIEIKLRVNIEPLVGENVMSHEDLIF